MRAVWLVTMAAVCVAVGSRWTTAQSAADRRAVEAAMMKADEALNQSVADRNMDKFLSLVADDATFGGGTPNQLRGREAVGKGWSVYFQPDGPRVTWKPSKAEALAGLDVGYTTGFAEFRIKAKDGSIKITHGNYLTVWRKQADGSWQAVFDTGSVVPDAGAPKPESPELQH